jgi:hypothetical protein
MDINVDIVILMIISLIFGVFIGLNIKTNKNNQENIVNLDDSRKIELSKCCTDSKCYSKPPHLRDNCNNNKREANEQLDQNFKQMYSQEEYYKKLDELKITKDMSEKQLDEAYIAKMNERIVVNKALEDKKIDVLIRSDQRDEVSGYDVSNYAPFKKN